MMDNKLQVGDLVGIVCCSDGRETSNRDIIEKTIRIFHDAGFQTLVSPYIYRIKGLESGTPKERAEALMNMYQNPSVKAIFDIGGGDLAIQLLEYLDFRVIHESGKEFWGYSDLTTIITSIYQKTGNSSWLYQTQKAGRGRGRSFYSLFQSGDQRSNCLPPGADFLHRKLNFFRAITWKVFFLVEIFAVF